MPNPKITEYLKATQSRKIREDLVFAANNVSEPKIAIDCGCGAGADIDYLARNGFTVYGFDIEAESISKCRSRFEMLDNVILEKSSFAAFEYPKASLVVADSSLFFCPKAEFSNVWKKIRECLYPTGVFCGSFLGSGDTMAAAGDNPSRLWPDVTVFEESEVVELFKGFEVLRFNTHRSTGKTPYGSDHDWHIFQVVART